MGIEIYGLAHERETKWSEENLHMDKPTQA